MRAFFVSRRKFYMGTSSDRAFSTQKERAARLTKGIQLFSSKVAPQVRQWTVMRPLPRGTRICWPQLGHLK